MFDTKAAIICCILVFVLSFIVGWLVTGPIASLRRSKFGPAIKLGVAVLGCFSALLLITPAVAVSLHYTLFVVLVFVCVALGLGVV